MIMIMFRHRSLTSLRVCSYSMRLGMSYGIQLNASINCIPSSLSSRVAIYELGFREYCFFLSLHQNFVSVCNTNICSVRGSCLRPVAQQMIVRQQSLCHYYVSSNLNSKLLCMSSSISSNIMITYRKIITAVCKVQSAQH